MEFVLQSAAGGKEESAAARLPELRLFTVERSHSFGPRRTPRALGIPVIPESAANFSAVAFYFGKEIQKTLHVPVGLIASDWGGTPAEAWTPRRALVQNPDFASLVKHWEGDMAQVSAWKKGVDFGSRSRTCA